jgi:hypothetical protein
LNVQLALGAVRLNAQPAMAMVSWSAESVMERGKSNVRHALAKESMFAVGVHLDRGNIATDATEKGSIHVINVGMVFITVIPAVEEAR